MIQQLTSYPSATIKFQNPERPRPIVAVVGIIHGNEPCGWHAIKTTERELRSSPLLKGTVYLIGANMAAYRRRSAFVDCDLNRAFNTRQKRLHEQKIVYHLRNIFSQCDYILDIHSSTTTIEPFVARCNSRYKKLAHHLLDKFVVVDKSLARGALFTEFSRTLLVECGRDLDQKTFRLAEKIPLRFLTALLMIRGQQFTSKKPKVYFATERLALKGFRVTGFKSLKRAQKVGESALVRMTTKRQLYPMVIDDINGEKTVLLAQQIGPG